MTARRQLNTAELMILKAARWVAWNYSFGELEDRLNEAIDESDEDDFGPTDTAEKESEPPQ